MRRDAGFTLLETICVLAIVGLLAALALPAMPLQTSGPRVEGYALQIAAMLKADRVASIASGAPVSTALSATEKMIVSGSTGRRLALPQDVQFDALLPGVVRREGMRSAIDFFPSGMSCGGTVEIRRPGAGFEVRVNWLTGGVEIVSVGAR